MTIVSKIIAIGFLALLSASAMSADIPAKHTPAFGTSAGEGSAWNMWTAELRRRCPLRHVEWVGDGGYDDLLGKFEVTLPLRTQRKLDRLEDFSHHCQTANGFTCEMLVSLDAYRVLGLLGKFSSFG
jgi:hypothetical protein